MKVLLAEDHEKVARHIAAGLREEGYVVEVAADGNEAHWLASEGGFDALVLDINLPGMDGIQVIRKLRRAGCTTPAIFVTARDAIEDRIEGLDAGGDDYLVKPFSLQELLARLRALLRRQRAELNNVIRVGDLEIDMVSRRARRAGREIELTNREFALLVFLAEASPRPLGRTALIEHVWEQHFDPGSNVLSVYVRYLREKIDGPGEEPLIHTVRGIGYALHPGGEK